MKLTDNQYELLTLIDERTTWDGDERPGTNLHSYFIPKRTCNWSSTLKRDVLISPQTVAAGLKALEKRGFIQRITVADRYGAAITEGGMVALEEYREKYIYNEGGRFPK